MFMDNFKPETKVPDSVSPELDSARLDSLDTIAAVPETVGQESFAPVENPQLVEGVEISVAADQAPETAAVIKDAELGNNHPIDELAPEQKAELLEEIVNGHSSDVDRMTAAAGLEQK